MLKEMLNTGQLHKLEKISQMIQDGVVKNPEYLLSDSKGKLIPEFLASLSKSLIINENKMANVLEELIYHIARIKDDLVFQNEILRTSGLEDEVFIEDICNHAIQLAHFSEEGKNIQIKKQFIFNKSILLTKTKILFVLTSLLRNAKKSLLLRTEEKSKIIDFIVKKSDDTFIEIQISHNGMGLEKEELAEILIIEHNVKSKEKDFRLPVCAVLAKEMGGSLTAESKGPNHGVSFIFKLPIKLSPRL
jgi:signal transduction histidine kinase